MLEIIRDNNGNILSACEWWKVNYSGTKDSKGKIIWISDIEVSKNYRNNGIIKRMIKSIYDKAPDFEHCYFMRKKYNKRIRMYPRNWWLKRIGEKI